MKGRKYGIEEGAFNFILVYPRTDALGLQLLPYVVALIYLMQ